MNILKSHVGQITSNDIEFAELTMCNLKKKLAFIFFYFLLAKILLFNVKPLKEITLLAAKRKIDIRIYHIIYRLVDDVTSMLISLLPVKYVEKISGVGEIIKVFEIDVGSSHNKIKVAGVLIQEGYIKKESDASHISPLTLSSLTSELQILRNGKSLVNFPIKIKEMKQEKKDITTITKGLECGIQFEQTDINFREGDIIQYITKTPTKSSL